MKYKKSIIYLTLITAAGLGCKKGNPGATPPPVEKKITVSTLAGNGTDAFVNGPVLSAEFDAPIDVAYSAGGIIYVSDYNNRRIRKISGGQVSVLAGNGTYGSQNGAADQAQFKDPYRIEIDAAGNLYVLEQNNPHVRKITPDGIVSDFAGTSVPGFKDGDVSVAQFAVDQGGITFDAQGIMYIDDTFNGRIRKISAGQVSTFAGKEAVGFVNGDTSVAQFQYADAILFDRQGNMYVADNGNFCIRKITPAGQVSKFAGTGTNGKSDGGPGVAQFHYIYDMVIDKDGNLILSDEDRIRKVTPEGIVSTVAGSTAGYADGDSATAKFHYPSGLAIDPDGNIYVADALNNRIRKISFR